MRGRWEEGGRWEGGGCQNQTQVTWGLLSLLLSAARVSWAIFTVIGHELARRGELNKYLELLNELSRFRTVKLLWQKLHVKVLGSSWNPFLKALSSTNSIYCCHHHRWWQLRATVEIWLSDHCGQLQPHLVSQTQTHHHFLADYLNFHFIKWHNDHCHVKDPISMLILKLQDN